MIRVFLAEDHLGISHVISLMLSQANDITLLGTSQSGMAALEEIAVLKPDLIILDVSLPEMNGLEMAQHLRQQNCSAAILLISAQTNVDLIVKALQVGSGFLLKQNIGNFLLPAIRSLMDGQDGQWIDPHARRALQSAMPGIHAPETR